MSLGRPVVATNQRRAFGITAHVSETDLVAIERARASLGMTRTEFIRLALDLLVKDVEDDAAENGH